MTDLDHASINSILPSVSGSADWDDVLGRARAGQARHRRRLVALAAAALVVTVGTACAFGAVRDFVLDKGFIGLPPSGAAPSNPDGAELVLSAWGVHGGARTRLWAYTDGRLIWQREFGHSKADLPQSANSRSSGFLEQRLTPEGVELLRAEIVSTGLFDHDLELDFDASVPAACLNFVHVRRGQRLVRVQWHGVGCLPHEDAPMATRAQETALQRLVTRLLDPTAWLPARAWDVRKIRAYVPSRYAIRYGGVTQTVEPSRILALLPKPARELLGHKSRTRLKGFYGFANDLHVVYGYTSEVTTEEARALADALDNAGVERARVLVYGLGYSGPIPDSPGNTFQIDFEPILPDGERICSACG